MLGDQVDMQAFEALVGMISALDSYEVTVKISRGELESDAYYRISSSDENDPLGTKRHLIDQLKSFTSSDIVIAAQVVPSELDAEKLRTGYPEAEFWRVTVLTQFPPIQQCDYLLAKFESYADASLFKLANVNSALVPEPT